MISVLYCGYALYRISEIGFITTRSLAAACLDVLNEKVSKDDATRLTFTREMTLTIEHQIYACYDAVYTWELYMALKAKRCLKTVETHTIFP